MIIVRAGFPALAVPGAPLQVITHSLSERRQGGYLHRPLVVTAADSNRQLFDLSSSQNSAPLLLGHCTQQEIFTARILCVSANVEVETVYLHVLVPGLYRPPLGGPLPHNSFLHSLPTVPL